MHPFLSRFARVTRRRAALALILAVAVGLGLLRFAPGETRPSVPTGTRAGDLMLSPCTYATEDGNFAADCGTLVVPENRADPDSRLIALPVTRIKATTVHPGEPVFRLEGGPGKSNMRFPQAGRLVGERDVVLVGYRGADGSVRLDCPEVLDAMRHTRDLLSAESLAAKGRALSACATRLRQEGVDLAGYTIPARVDDLEAARVALGYGRINLISESAGTRYALVYSWRYPHAVARSVMIGVNPPGHFLYSPRITDQQIDRYAALCARSERCRARTPDLSATIRQTLAALPDRWGFLPIRPGNTRAATFFGLVHSTDAAGPLSGPVTLDSWLNAAEGEPAGLWLLSLLGGMLLPQGIVWGESAAMGMQDAAYARAYLAAGGSDGSIGAAATDFLWAGGALADAWPHYPDHDLYADMQPSAVETLLISGTLDFATPPQVSTEKVLPYLANGRQVLLSDLGHTDDFWTYQPEANRHLLTAFFRDGTVDPSRYTHYTPDFTPGVTGVWLAKLLLCVLVGFPGAALLALVAMALRLWRWGAFGVKSSAALRALLPVVLGLGGWFLGVLLALPLWPWLALDDAWIVVPGVGLPVGAGIALAWLNPTGWGRRQSAGLPLALCAALAGAWLGDQAVAGPPAILTTIAGATAAANLALLMIDAATTGRYPINAQTGTPLGTTRASAASG